MSGISFSMAHAQSICGLFDVAGRRAKAKRISLARTWRFINRELPTVYEGLESLASFTEGNYRVRRIQTFKYLAEVATALNICSATRSDLIEGFFRGEHLRWAIEDTQGNIHGVFALMPNGRREVKPFKFYGLGKQHSRIRKRHFYKYNQADLFNVLQAFSEKLFSTRLFFYEELVTSQMIDFGETFEEAQELLYEETV